MLFVENIGYCGTALLQYLNRSKGSAMPNISGCTKTSCLIGSPVEHSLSPAMHTFSFEQLGVDCVYLAYNVEPDQLEAAVNGMKELGFLGYNVTMPH